MEKWFYNGTKMPDGTPISVCAYNAVQEKDFLKKGFKPVPMKDAKTDSQTEPGDDEKHGDGTDSPEGSPSPSSDGQSNTDQASGTEGSDGAGTNSGDAGDGKKKEDPEEEALEKEAQVNEPGAF